MRGNFSLVQRPLTMCQQIALMAQDFPQFRVIKLRRDREVAWRGTVQPSSLSARYEIRVQFLFNVEPRTFVLSPELVVRPEAKRLPHVYRDGALCLNVFGEWKGWMPISSSTIPWASSWLYFYEVWLATGSWEGGGTHPDWPEHRSSSYPNEQAAR